MPLVSSPPISHESISMWLFTRIGFYSAVAARGDEHKVVVRARRKGHLTKLNLHLVSIGESVGTISTSTNTDYPCRMLLAKAVWARACETLAEGIDYDNFKGSIDKSREGNEYHDALLDVWTIMRNFQE